MSACPQCGNDNKEDTKFCIKCGASLEAPVQAPPQAPAAAPVPPPQAAQPTYQQSAQYQQPAQYTQPSPPPGAYQQQAYAAPPAAPQMAAYAPAPAYATKSRGAIFWIGALIVLVSGILVLVSTWMSWGSGSGGFLSLSGWDWFDIGKAGGGGSGEVVNAFFIYSDGYPLFTGLCSLILGGLIALMGVLILVTRSKGLGGLAILFSLFALGMAITNLTTILRTEGISVGVGTIIFLIFSLAGLVGGGMATSG